MAEEVVSAAEAWGALEAQPQPSLVMTSVRRDSVGMELAVLTDDLLPAVDQQQVLAR